MTSRSDAQLIVLDDARKALAKVASVDEAKRIRDKAEAIRNYAKQQQLGLDAQNKAAEIKIRAERRAGELLAEVERKDSAANLKRGPTRQPDASGNTYTDTLETAGIAEPTARRWQTMADMNAATFEAHVAAVKDSGGELTSAGVLRAAVAEAPRTPQALDPMTVILRSVRLMNEALQLLKSADRKAMKRLSEPDLKGFRSTLDRIADAVGKLKEAL